MTVTVATAVVCTVPFVIVFVVVVVGLMVLVCFTVEVTTLVLVAPYTGFLIYAAHSSYSSSLIKSEKASLTEKAGYQEEQT